MTWVRSSGALVVAALLSVGLGGAEVPTQEGDSRVETLEDSRVIEFGERTVIRQGGQPVIDTSSTPDSETVSLRSDVLFDFGSAAVTPAGGAVVAEAVRQIQAQGAQRLVIMGHTDSIGNDADNQILSEQRAAAVAAAIQAELGASVPPAEVGGRGESEPVAPNELPNGDDNPAGRALNRRVEIEVIT